MADAPRKRQVKNPETFREKALKATAQGEQPKHGRRIRAAAAKPFKVALSPVGRTGRKLGGKQPFAFLRLVFHYVGLILLPRYLRNSFRELRLVTWPTWKQSRRLTFAVLVFAIVFGAAVAGVDYGLDRAFKHLLLK